MIRSVRKRSVQQGFTLTEILITLACLGLFMVASVQAVQYMKFSQDNIESRTMLSQNTDLLKANLDEILLNTTSFFDDVSEIPTKVKQDTTLESRFSLPVPTDDPDNVTRGNTLFFATTELVPIEKLRPDATWQDSGRLSLTTIHCLYLRRTKESGDGNPGAFELVHYSDPGFISAASADSFYLWNQGISPNNNGPADRAALTTYLQGQGYTLWEPTSNSPPSPSAFARTRRLMSYLGKTPTSPASKITKDSASDPKPPLQFSVVRNVIETAIETEKYSPTSKKTYSDSKQVDVLTRKLRLN